MIKFRKAIAVALSLSMVFGVTACGKGSDQPQTIIVDNGDVAASQGSAQAEYKPRTNDLQIGTWYINDYDSSSAGYEDLTDWANAQDKEGDDDATKAEHAVNRKQMQQRYERLKSLEKKYGIKVYWNNLTVSGVRESINTSILAGAPDCDIYFLTSDMAIPAQTNGLALDLKTILPADHDLFTTQTVASYVDLGDGKACILIPQGGMDNTNPLAFNIQMLEENNLEDPRDLWDRGEWTWDKFNEYMQILTQDTDGDGQIDQYGYCGWDTDLLEELMMSNGANIAATNKEALSSPQMTEVLQQIYDMYNVMNVCYPVNKDMDSNEVRLTYRKGNIAFWWGNVWLNEQNGSDYDWGGKLGYTLPFDIAYCHWPVGPSGNQETDAQLNRAGTRLYIIPTGVEDPLTVINFLYDWWNWYEGDTAWRDDPATKTWWINASARTDELRQRNWQTQLEIYARPTLDLWNSMGVSYNLWELMDGTVTPAQFQETHKQEVQDALNQTLGN